MAATEGHLQNLGSISFWTMLHLKHLQAFFIFCHVCIDMKEFTKSIYTPFVLQCGFTPCLDWQFKKLYIIAEQTKENLFMKWMNYVT